MRLKRWLAGLTLCIGLSAGSAHAGVTEDTFLLHNTGDLVELCSAAQADPLYKAAAVIFCLDNYPPRPPEVPRRTSGQKGLSPS